jgi:uncharacterized protein (TIGR03000 family)
MPPRVSAPVYSSPPYTSHRVAPPANHAVASANRKVASLVVQVPEQAVVYLGNFQSKGTGKKRRYVRKNLQPGQIVTYQVRAEIMLHGKKIQKTKQVDLRAGAVANLEFDFIDVVTSLTLRVPPDASVYLANSEKQGTGTVRKFTSTKLAIGRQVLDFPIRVSVERNGRLISKVQRISLTSGESRTLSFRFNEEASIAAIH